jgi:hypothetical protein
MQKIKQLTSTTILILLLGGSSFAGIIECPAPPPPPPATNSATNPGDIWISGDKHTPGKETTSMTDMATNLVLELLSVF